jgi:CBS domain-containing membrane protein
MRLDWQFIRAVMGSSIAIYCIFKVSNWIIGTESANIILSSMGASAILLFYLPKGELSQPWPVFGGHISSALIGVSCAHIFAEPAIAASIAVGLAIIIMHYLRCLHPPGGATALTAIIGGESVQQLGYQFVIAPVLLNVLIILLINWIFNKLVYTNVSST